MTAHITARPASDWPGPIPDGPAIYVACLASYNAGILHGRWIDATLGEAHIQTEAVDMLYTSTQPEAEEWAIHDHANWGSGWHPGESESFADVAAIAALIDKYGEAYAAFLDNRGGLEYASEAEFEDAYRGEYRSLTEWAEEFCEEAGYVDQVPAALKYHIDFESFARDAELGGDIFSVPGGLGVYVFCKN
jgi:antirestriction protein